MPLAIVPHPNFVPMLGHGKQQRVTEQEHCLAVIASYVT